MVVMKLSRLPSTTAPPIASRPLQVSRRAEAEQQQRLGYEICVYHCLLLLEREKMDCSLANVDARKMEVCLSIFPLVIGLRATLRASLKITS
jgi:hypothetical protein